MRKLITSRHKQRGNIVFTTGLPPTEIPNVTGGPGGDWTLIEEWETSAGDLASITAAFGGSPRGTNLWWSPDGLTLTLGSSTNDTLKSFNCSTPFDPETASEVSTRGILNPTSLRMNDAGTQLYVNEIVGDLWSNYPAIGHRFTGGAKTSDVDKSEVGFAGSTDGNASFDPAGNYMLWDGDDAGDKTKDVSILGGDMNSPSVIQTEVTTTNPTLVIGKSRMYDGATKWLQGEGAPGISFCEMDAARDIATAVYGVAQSIAHLTFVRPREIWFNPLDTREIWCMGDQTGLKLCRLATNVPVPL